MGAKLAAAAKTTLRLAHRFAAPRETVFAAWTTAEALSRWWCPPGWHPTEIDVDLRIGGGYRLAMVRESGTRSVAVSGRFLHVRRPVKLIYSWRWEGVFPEMPETRVTVEFRSAGRGTELVLSQEELPLRFCAQHLSGWLAAWQRIAEVLARSSTEVGAIREPVRAAIPGLA